MTDWLASLGLLVIGAAYAVVRFRHADLTEPQFVIRFWPWYAGVFGLLIAAAVIATFRRCKPL